jgi:hypothetical protein
MIMQILGIGLFEIGYVVQGAGEHQLPETILACIGMDNGDPATAPLVD